MKGSVFLLLGCFALFAAPSHSVPEGDRFANSRDARSGSPSTDAGESGTIEMDGDAKWTDESVAGDVRAERSKIRKRDTRSVLGDYDSDLATIDKEYALDLFKQLGKYGGQCFEKAAYYVQPFEKPAGFVEPRHPKDLFTRSDMVKWLKTLTSSVSECLMTYFDQLGTENPRLGDDMRDSVRSDTFADVPALMSPLLEIGKTLERCVQDAIGYLEATPQGRGDKVQRSSESFPDLLPELMRILSLIDGRAVRAGDTVPVSPHPYSPPVKTTYKKRNSPGKRRGYRHYSNPPGYVNNKNIPVSRSPQFSASGAAAVQVPYTPGMTALPSQQLSLLNVVLDQIYSKLQGKASPAGNTDAASAEGLRVDADGALGFYPGSGDSPGDHGFNPDCVRPRVQRRTAERASRA